MFEEAVARFGDVEAIVDGDERVTFAGWWARAGEVAALLADHGVGRGDGVASLLPTSVDYALTHVAAVRLGAVMSGLNPRLGPDEVASILSIAEPKVVVGEAESVPLASAWSSAVVLRAAQVLPVSMQVSGLQHALDSGMHRGPCGRSVGAGRDLHRGFDLLRR